MDIIKTIKANLKKYREGQKISQRQLAFKMDISPSHYSRMELGRVEPTISSLNKAAIALDVELYKFFLPIDSKELPMSEKFKKIKGLPREDQAVINRIINMALEREDMKRELF